MKRTFGTTERGAAGIKAIIAVIILAVAIYVGVVMIPIYAAHYDLEDKLKEDILFASQRFRENIAKELTVQVYSYLDNMGVVYEKKNVRVNTNSSTKFISVELWYNREHKIPGFPKQFHLKVEGKYGL